MGYWPKSVKRRRHNWVTELGRKLVLLGCTGHHEHVSMFAPKFPNVEPRKLYVLNHPDFQGEKAWVMDAKQVQVKAWSEDSATIKGARMMEII